MIPAVPGQANTVTAVTSGLNRAEPSRITADRRMMKVRKKRSTLTFSQPVLEVRVTPSFPVEIDAVTDEQSPAHPRGYRAGLTAHHNSRDPVG